MYGNFSLALPGVARTVARSSRVKGAERPPGYRHRVGRTRPVVGKVAKTCNANACPDSSETLALKPDANQVGGCH